MPLVPPAKITIPALPPDFVVRAGLCADLDAGAAAPGVALVCAPAGWGKTMLLADWSLASTTVDTAWVGLDGDDNDPRRLWASIVAAVAACPSVPSSSPPGGQGPIGERLRGPEAATLVHQQLAIGTKKEMRARGACRPRIVPDAVANASAHVDIRS